MDSGPTIDGARNVDGSTGAPVLPNYVIERIYTELGTANEGDDDMVFTADRLEVLFNKNGDVYSSTRASITVPWNPPTLVAELSSVAGETTFAMTTDGLNFMFASDRAEPGDHDVYLSSRSSRAETWSEPARVGELSTTSGDFVGWLADESSDRISPLTGQRYYADYASQPNHR